MKQIIVIHLQRLTQVESLKIVSVEYKSLG